MFTKALLGEVKSRTLTSSKAEVEKFLRTAHCDTSRRPALGDHPKINRAEFPTKELDTGEPSWREVQEVVKKAR